MGTYHWGLYYHCSRNATMQSGVKFHINLDMGSNRWMTDHGWTNGVLNSTRLIGLLRIASIPTYRSKDMMNLIERTPHNAQGITCRVWVLNAIQNLMAFGLVRCMGISWLENEAIAFGLAEDPYCQCNVQPRPTRQSRVCYI
ncbi:hypothetical protein J3A83DRAFT_3489563 [Scleroderma citrinum]